LKVYCFQLTPEEDERRRMRRERNKFAAAKCRQKRVDLTNQLLAVSFVTFCIVIFVHTSWITSGVWFSKKFTWNNSKNCLWKLLNVCWCAFTWFFTLLLVVFIMIIQQPLLKITLNAFIRWPWTLTFEVDPVGNLSQLRSVFFVPYALRHSSLGRRKAVSPT